MEFRYLVSFLALADELHFGRAAAKLHLTQPSLSQQLQRLERKLGVTLVARSSHEVRLTPAGEVLRDHARSIVADLERATRATRAAADGRFEWHVNPSTRPAVAKGVPGREARGPRTANFPINHDPEAVFEPSPAATAGGTSGASMTTRTSSCCTTGFPTDYLRLGYASSLSSWALVNSGTPESGFGHWFPSANNDGAAGGARHEQRGQDRPGRGQHREVGTDAAVGQSEYSAAHRPPAPPVERGPQRERRRHHGEEPERGRVHHAVSRRARGDEETLVVRRSPEDRVLALLGLVPVVRADDRGGAAGDLAHGGQQRQAPAVGERLEGVGADAGLQQRPGQVGLRRQMQVGEQGEAGTEPAVLGGLGLLDLDDDVAGPDLGRVGYHLGARFLVVGVGVAGAGARAGLDDHVVPPLHGGGDRGGRQRDAPLLVLDLGR